MVMTGLEEYDERANVTASGLLYDYDNVCMMPLYVWTAPCERNDGAEWAG